MGEYALRRVLQLIPLLLGVTLVMFLLIHLAPGDPVEFMMGVQATDQDLHRSRRYLGFDKPIHEQYFDWLGNALNGDFGRSYMNKRPVMAMFWERFPATALLMGTANLLSLLIAIPLGVISALRQYSRLDNVVTVLAFGGIAMPSFTLSLVTMYLFGVVLHWFPLGGMRSIGVSSIPDLLWHLALPVGVLTFATTAYWMRFVRSSVLEVIRQDYVVLALAKGLPGQVVITRYVMRNAFLPLITLFGLSLPELFTGSMIVEWIFNWPGVGQMILRAGNNHDFTVVMGIVTIVSIAVVIGNLLADLVYSWADPRIKY